MSDLLKEAIADAKAVRETALQNAKMALEEAFTPHLKSMLSAKLAEEDIEEDENPFADKDEDDEEESADEGMHDSPRREEDDEEDPEEGMHDSPRREEDDEEEVDESEIVEIDGVKYAPIVTEDEHEDEEDEMDESEELDLEAVIKELEEELNETESDDDDEEKSKKKS